MYGNTNNAPPVQPNLQGGSSSQNIVNAATITHPEGDNPFFYKLSFKNDGTEKSIFYIYFLRYALTTPRTVLGNGSTASSYVGKHKSNQVNIQATRPGIQKQIHNYVSSCLYNSQSFYKHLETLGKHPEVKSVFFASALSSHDSGFNTHILNGDTYLAARRGPQNQIFLRTTTLSNRYLEDFCEILRVMRQIQKAHKDVYYITLDPQFRVFDHQNVSRTSTVPYEVPFQDETTFFINDPPYFHRVIENLSAPFPYTFAEGGKRKSRKQRRKAKKTRKHRV
jgi:hypothetical protein